MDGLLIFYILLVPILGTTVAHRELTERYSKTSTTSIIFLLFLLLAHILRFGITDSKL
jgi:hypothetical protein